MATFIPFRKRNLKKKEKKRNPSTLTPILDKCQQQSKQLRGNRGISLPHDVPVSKRRCHNCFHIKINRVDSNSGVHSCAEL